MARIPEIIHESWHNHLKLLFLDQKMDMINDQLLMNCYYYPHALQIFNVFRMPLDKIKVVVLGQDPYPNGEGIGYAFAVQISRPLPRSLNIIKNEILRSKVERDTHISTESDMWKELKHWRQQGVFLLNSALTVEAKKPNSHMLQWQWFTREVVRIIAKEVAPVWLLWGAKARLFDGEILSAAEPTKVNKILYAPHPAAEAYENGDSRPKFTGSNVFVECNAILKSKQQSVINW